MAEVLEHCRWCGKPRRRWSNWEQQRLSNDEWARLCMPCADRRLRNPWSALLPMREIDAARAPLAARPTPRCGRDGCDEPKLGHRDTGCIRIGCECTGWEEP